MTERATLIFGVAFGALVLWLVFSASDNLNGWACAMKDNVKVCEAVAATYPQLKGS